MRPKIYFRADGNSQIGWGHVIRTLALAEMLNEEFDCIFVTRFLNVFFGNEIQRVCKQQIILSSDNHLAAFLDVITDEDIVVLDNYFFTSEFQLKIKERSYKLVCIDDLFDKHYYADLVINHTHDVNCSFFSCEDYTRLALGFEYALLRKPFYTREIPTERSKNIFISFGGGNSNIIVEEIIAEILSNPSFHDNIFIVTGANNELNSSLFDCSNITIYKNLKAHEMAALMDRCFFAIVPSSSILIECLSRGLKIITGHYSDNQKYIYNTLVNNNFVLGLGDLNRKNQIKTKLLETIDFLPTWESSCNIDFRNGQERMLKLFLSL